MPKIQYKSSGQMKMKRNSAKNDNIHFLDFKFNYNLRMLEKNGRIINLVKKEADVLALLCDKAPNPVTPMDFNRIVWKGRYVTSQSIAQVIRSLRLKLEDNGKNIIITMPKLGYKLLPSVTVNNTEENEIVTKKTTACQGCGLIENIAIKGSSMASGIELDAALNQIKGLQNLILHKILELEKISKSSYDVNLYKLVDVNFEQAYEKARVRANHKLNET